MMHVMIRDGLVDHEYVSQHAIGYEALAERARQYSPEQVSHTVGLPVEEIERFAREYATTQPSLLRPLIGMEHHRNGAMQLRTLACLAVLSGAWRHRGGGLARSTHVLQFATLDMDRVLMPRGAQARRPRAQHARSRQRSVQPRTAAAGTVAHGVRRQSDGVDAESRPRSRGTPARGPVYRRARLVRHRYRALCRLRPARDEPDRASGSVARMGPSVSRVESPGDCAARRIGVPTPNCSAGWRRRWAAPRRGSSRATSRCCAGRLRAGTRGSKGSRSSGCGKRATRGCAARRIGGRLRMAALPRDRERRNCTRSRCRSKGTIRCRGRARFAVGDGLQLITGKSLHFLNSGYSNMDRHRRRAGDLFIEIHPDDARRGAWRLAMRCACGTAVAKCARLLGVGPRAPGRGLDAVRRVHGCERRAAIGERAHRRGADRLGRRQRPL